MAVDILRTESNERVDLGDFDFVSESIQAHERQMVDNFLCDPGRTRKWVLSGFAMDCPAGKQLRVTKGKAILAQRVGGAMQYGVLTTEGDATLTVDLNSYSAGAYGVYVRFERVAGENQSRIFWDPSGAGSEYAQAINTRLTAAWSMRVEGSNPGADWLKIGEVDQGTLAPPTTGLTDQREFYFEGAVVGAYPSGWSTEGGGAANDRNADRAVYGVTDLQMAFAAVRQCITDIRGRGLRKWYEKGIGGMNLGFDSDPVEDALSVGDSLFTLNHATPDVPYLGFDSGDTLQYDRPTNVLAVRINGNPIMEWSGSEIISSGGGVTLGSATYPWDNVYASKLNLEDAADYGVESDCNPTDDGTYDLGSSTREWQDLWLDGTANIDGLSLSVTAGEGLISHFLPGTDGIYDLGDSAAGLGVGTDRRFSRLFLTNGWQVEDTSTVILNMRCGSAPAHEKWWQFKMDSGGLFSIVALDDSYANPVDMLTIGRTGATANSADLTLYGVGACQGWRIAAPVPTLTLYDTDEATAHTKFFKMLNDDSVDTVFLRFYDDAETSFGNILGFRRNSIGNLYECNRIYAYADFYPDTASAHDLGSSTEYWQDVHAENLSLFDTADNGGESGFTTITGIVDTSVSSGAGIVLMKTTNAGPSAGWLKIYSDTTPYYIPIWLNISP